MSELVSLDQCGCDTADDFKNSFFNENICIYLQFLFKIIL